MKKFIVILLVSACGNLMAADFASGSGTRSDPYIITKSEHLSYLAEKVKDSGWSYDKYFRLEANILLWLEEQPIGISETAPFQGVFDGGGNVIQNFWHERKYADNTVIGLFGYTSGAEITNLTIEGGRLSNEQGTYIGALIGNASKTVVTNCSVKNMEIIVNGDATGGLIGYGSEVTVTNCHTIGGTITGSSYVGGLIGKMEEPLWGTKGSTISNCSSSCLITGVRNVGGFIGAVETTSAFPIEISGCCATGSVLGFTDIVGGFVGACHFNNTSISNCYATGSATGASRSGSKEIGGFIGYNRAKQIDRCYSSGSVTGTENIGGFCGSSVSSAITCCYAVGAVEGKLIIDHDGTPKDVRVGGFTGFYSGGEIKKCFAAGAVITPNLLSASNIFSGAFVGFAGNTNLITNCYFDKQTTGLLSADGFSMDGLTGVQASITSALTPSTTQPLPGFTPSTDWVFRSGYYPQLNVFANQSATSETRSWSALSAVPFKLANDTELCSNLKTVVTLINQTPAGNAVTWLTEPLEDVTVLNNATVYAKGSETWRTLTLRSGNMERNVKFRSTIGMTVAEIQNVVINYETFYLDDDHFTHLIQCGLPDISVFVEINLSPYSDCSPGSPILLHANTLQEVTVISLDKTTKTYYFLAEKHLPKDIYVQRWDDVIAINNNFNTNGGYIISAYEWLKNNEPMPNENKGYIRITEPASYKAKVVTQHGKLSVCPMDIPKMPVLATVYPNPAVDVVTLEFDATGAFNITITDIAGMVLKRETATGRTAQIDISSHPAGVYLLTIDDGKRQNAFRIVKN